MSDNLQNSLTINEFREFPKLARLSRECLITEKLDGTNAQIFITERTPEIQPLEIDHWTDTNGQELSILAGSRNKYITPQADNYGFAGWVSRNVEELKRLGPGRHFGEWWGNGIQRKYGMKEKRFSLFNTIRWCLHNQTPQILPSNNPMSPVKYQDVLPPCCHLVPVLYRGLFTTEACEEALNQLRTQGSVAAPGFMNPEGIVVFHIAGNIGFKKTLDNDALPKSLVTAQ